MAIEIYVIDSRPTSMVELQLSCASLFALGKETVPTKSPILMALLAVSARSRASVHLTMSPGLGSHV